MVFERDPVRETPLRSFVCPEYRREGPLEEREASFEGHEPPGFKSELLDLPLHPSHRSVPTPSLGPWGKDVATQGPTFVSGISIQV